MLGWVFSALALSGCTAMLGQQVTPVAAPGYVERELRIPVAQSQPAGLDVLEVYVNTPGKHPLALLTHGTSNKPEERMQITPWAQLPQALWFAERGYVALVVVRRGYGRSGGVQDGRYGGCSAGGSFTESGEDSAEDLRNVAAYAAEKMPEVDGSAVVSAGVSTGGFAQVALTANPPPGLKAAISFAGGRGGDGAGHLCDKGNLLHAFQAFGKKSHTPMLWMYAENNKWFPPPFAAEFAAAFEKGGGTDEFVHAPAISDDGHHLYAHVAAWSAAVETFLGAHQLLPLATPYAAPTPPAVEPPAGLSEHAQAVFRTFLILGPNKAFATNGQGHYGYSVGEFTHALADEQALANCNKVQGGGPACTIVSRGVGK
jgi:dienelactone hydrolase